MDLPDQNPGADAATDAAADAAAAATAAATLANKPVWHCVEEKCKVKVDPKNFFSTALFEDIVRNHVKMHLPPGTDGGGKKDRRKDFGDWGAMEKWPAETYPAGSLTTADFDGFEELIKVIINEYDDDERNSTGVKFKVLQKLEGLKLKGLEKKCMDPKVKMTDLLAQMRELMVAPTNWCKAAWSATHMKQEQSEPLLKFIERKEKAVKIAGLPWSGDGKCGCIKDMFKYTVMRGLSNKRLKDRISIDKELGNDTIKKMSWETVRDRLVKHDQDLDMEEDQPSNATVNRMSKTSYKEKQKSDKYGEKRKTKCSVCQKPGHSGDNCYFKCELKRC